MTVIARRVIATPGRSASEAWNVIIKLLAPNEESEARKELLNIAGIASCLIAEETIDVAPIIVYGDGPRVRIYCVYGDDAITGENANEASLPDSPMKGDWSMSLPCLPEDLEWVQTALKKHSSRISARELTAEVEVQKSQTEKTKTFIIDKEAFDRK